MRADAMTNLAGNRSENLFDYLRSSLAQKKNLTDYLNDYLREKSLSSNRTIRIVQCQSKDHTRLPY